jgi:tol-pal system protein YbgF
MRTRLLTALVAVGLTGCFYPSDRGRALETHVDQMQAKQNELAQALAEEQKKLDALRPQIEQKIQEVTEALANLDKASRRSGADIGVQLQKNVEDVAQLRGSLEEYQHKIDELQNGLKQLSDSTDQRLTALQGEQAQREAEAKKRAEGMKRPADKKEFLDLANQKQKDGDVALARQLYNEFLQKWPKDPLAGAAHFGLGESYYDEQKCREALFEYGKVIQEFPKSGTAPVAYLHSGDCFGKLGMSKESKLSYEEVVKSYPKTDAAKLAKKKLAAPAKPAKKTGKK